MSIICPTVTATDVETYNNQLKLVSGFAKRIHIDLMDGELAPTKTPDVKDISVSPDVINDIHVMYQNPQSIIDELIKLKPNMVIVHAESNADIPLLATKLRESGIKTGLAILPETTVDEVSYLFPHLQHVLVFGGHLGYHGGQADLSQLEKVPAIKKLGRHLEISWDGGANASNAVQLKQHGIDVINVGSGIHKAPTPSDAYTQLTVAVK